MKNCVTLEACISIYLILNWRRCSHLNSSPVFAPAQPSVAGGEEELEADVTAIQNISIKVQGKIYI